MPLWAFSPRCLGAAQPAFRNHIRHVLSLSAREQVIYIAAGRIIAVMADGRRLGWREVPVGFHPGKDMAEAYPLAKPQYPGPAVSTLIAGHLPFVTGSTLFWGKLGPFCPGIIHKGYYATTGLAGPSHSFALFGKVKNSPGWRNLSSGPMTPDIIVPEPR
jgi:hypothetical protein